MKLRILALALALVLCLTGIAAADSTIVSTYELNARDVVLNPTTNTMAVIPEGESDYVIMDANGTILSENRFNSVMHREGLFWFTEGNRINNEGFADGNGRILVPAVYGDVEVVDDRWQIGVKLKAATADNYDYKTFGSSEKYYLVTQYDVYFDGAFVGSLDRLQCAPAHCYAYGEYLYVRQKEGGAVYYDKNLTPSGYSITGGTYYEEFEYDRKTKAVWHKGSNQKAFCEGCTLTEDEVAQTIWVQDNEIGYDLQGNVLFDLTKRNYDIINKFKGDYASVKIGKLFGLIDRNGNEILPCDYEEIIMGGEKEYFESGYLLVRKDGKIGMVDPTGNEIVDFKYPAANCKTNSSPFFYLNDMEGKVVVLSPNGELSTRYKSITTKNSGVCPVFVAELEEDNVGLVDIAGNAVIPFDGTYDSTYKLELSQDGTVVVAKADYQQYLVYTLSHGAAPAEEEAVNPFDLLAQLAGANEATATEPAAEPAADKVVCSGCGYEPPAGQTPKFCSECGTPFPQKTVCKGCGYEPPAGQTPKFCSECGTAF